MLQTLHLNPTEMPLWLRSRIQLYLFLIGVAFILLKASAIGSLFGPRLFLWPSMLFYLSVFTTPFLSIVHILLISVLHDALFAHPMGTSSLCWLFWHFALALQRRTLYKASPFILWGLFALSLMLVNCLEWLLLKQANIDCDLNRILLEALLTTAFFPWLFHFFNRFFMRIGQTT